MIRGSLDDVLKVTQTQDRLPELLRLVDVDVEALRNAEFAQAQEVLRTIVGKTVAAADIDDTRITIIAADGSRYFFYGFLGNEAAAP